MSQKMVRKESTKKETEKSPKEEVFFAENYKESK